MKINSLKLTGICWLSSLCLALFLSPLASYAITVESVPNPRQIHGGWVTDMAEILTDNTETQLNQMISQLEAKNGAEMAVVTV
nr:TPM domain-containing protein [Nostocaceae cyanobacterium]